MQFGNDAVGVRRSLDVSTASWPSGVLSVLCRTAGRR